MGKSSSSSAGEHLSGAEDARWTSVDPELPLGSAEDELWQLLDVIQRKGTRLRHDLERAERCERERLAAGQTPHHHHHHHHLQHPAAPASDPLSSPRQPHPAAARDYWPHSLPGHTAADMLPPPPPPPPMGVALEAEAWAAVERLRQDRQYLMGRVGWAEAEAAASHQRLVDLHGQLLALAGDKRRLEDQVRALRMDTARLDPTPATLAAATPASASNSSSSQGGAFNTVTIVGDHTTTTATRGRRPSPAVTVSVAAPDAGEEVGAAAGRMRGVRGASSVRLNAERERDVVLPRVLKVPIRERAPQERPPRPAAPPPPREAPQEEEGGRGSDRVVIERERRAGRADGGLSMPVSLLKGARLRVTPNKQRISAILREKDVLELQRQLLTTVMEAEVLRKQIESASEEWASKTSEWEADHRLALATVSGLREENTRLKQQLEERPRVEQRDVGVCACPVMLSTGTTTAGGGAGVEEAPTHTVHAGPNVKYDVVVHQEERRGEGGSGGGGGGGPGVGVRKAAALVEKPPRRSRDPRGAPSPAPPQRESAESPGGRDSLGRASGSTRGRPGVSQSGRCTPTGTPRSSPAPSITPRMCTNRAITQDAPPRASPLTRSSSGTARSTLGRRDSLKAAQAKAAKASPGAAASAGTGGSQQKAASPHSADQGGVCQPRSLRQAPRSPRSPRSPCSPLTLSDLRTPSPSPAPSPAQPQRPAPQAGLRRGGVRKVGVVGAGRAGQAGQAASPRVQHVRRGGQGVSPQLRLSHLGPASPSPSPPASCSSYYDSINSDGPPASPSPAPDRLMQVEVAFEWTPVTTAPASPWPSSPRLPRRDSPSPWPPDSLEGAKAHFETSGHVRSQLAAMTAATAAGGVTAGLVRGRVEGYRGRGGGGGGGGGRPALPRQDQDLNTRVHQILTRIASGAQ